MQVSCDILGVIKPQLADCTAVVACSTIDNSSPIMQVSFGILGVRKPQQADCNLLSKADETGSGASLRFVF